MAIQGLNRASQVQDYISKVWNFQDNEIGNITQSRIAKALNVSQGSISSYLGSPGDNKKVFREFKAKFSKEMKSWPKHEATIGKVLQKADVLLFLGLTKQAKKEKKLGTKDLMDLQPKKRRKSKPKPMPVDTEDTGTLPRGLRRLRTQSLNHAPIAISYRGHKNLKDGQGALFDHMRFQRNTGHETRALYPRNKDVTNLARDQFKAALRQHPAQLPFGKVVDTAPPEPKKVKDSSDYGLLVIPGRVRKTAHEPDRLKHEMKTIKKALRIGQPILAICAGSWRLWQSRGGALVETTDHCYAGGMIRLDKGGKNACSNVQIHDIKIKTNSHLVNAMQDATTGKIPKRMSVNSVHWMAVDPDTTPENIRISAKSKHTPDLSLKNRQSEIYQPDENTVEAFETIHGAPNMGIQWHPEGYNRVEKRKPWDSMPHVGILTYMAKAGDAFAAKQRMLIQLKETLARK